jgi:phosphoenolpyruvate synthase/pyruvate phosphate dikinase
MEREGWVRWVEDIWPKNAPTVGGKAPALGELRALTKGRVPNGLALTAEAHRAALSAADIESELRRVPSDFDYLS